jgi:acetylornithine deacetylase/succinyl-diaminopimelate desuccinylase-like protein
MTVTSIVANSDAHNKIADSATVKVDSRYTAGDPNYSSPSSFAAHIKSIDSNATVTRYYDFSSPLYTSPKNRLLLELKAAAEAVEGAPFTFVRRHATSDGRYYGDVGNQACEFGIAGEFQHGDNEHITLDAFRDYLATMRAFLDRTADATHASL